MDKGLKNLQTAEKNIYEELRERDNRKKNIVIHQAPEPDRNQPAETKKEKDKEAITRIFEFIEAGVNTEEDPKFMYRAGEPSKTGNSDNPRPVIVGFHSKEKPETILRNSRKLREDRNKDFKDVTIIPDLTTRQRKEEAEMREEADKRNAELSEEEAGNYEWKVMGQQERED